jgi:diacylglycerol O-acyltransferase
MRQLSDQDAVFLYSETAHSNSNITLLHIYDQSTAPGGKVRFKSILAHVENRLERVPILRQRLQQVPLRLDRPYWVEYVDFNL